MTLLDKLQALEAEECFCESYESPCPRCCMFMELGKAHIPALVEALESFEEDMKKANPEGTSDWGDWMTAVLEAAKEHVSNARTVLAKLEEALDA